MIKKLRNAPKGVKILLWTAAAVLLLAVIAALTLFFMHRAGQRSMTETPEDGNENYREIIAYQGKNYVYNPNISSVALIGVDKRELGKAEGTTENGMADMIALLVIDRENGKATLLSLPRDTICDIDMYKGDSPTGVTRARLCTSFGYGDGKQISCENTVRALRRLLYGVPVQKYVCLDLDGLGKLGDTVGGVEVQSLIDLDQFDIQKGDRVTLTGTAAERYLRIRDHEQLDGASARAERQMQYCTALSAKLAETIKKDVSRALLLYQTCLSFTLTDITANDVTYLAGTLLSKDFSALKTQSIKGDYSAEKIGDSGDVYAAFTPDQDALYQTVLSLFYLPIN